MTQLLCEKMGEIRQRINPELSADRTAQILQAFREVVEVLASTTEWAVHCFNGPFRGDRPSSQGQAEASNAGAQKEVGSAARFGC